MLVLKRVLEYESSNVKIRVLCFLPGTHWMWLNDCCHWLHFYSNYYHYDISIVKIKNATKQFLHQNSIVYVSDQRIFCRKIYIS